MERINPRLHRALREIRLHNSRVNGSSGGYSGVPSLWVPVPGVPVPGVPVPWVPEVLGPGGLGGS